MPKLSDADQKSLLTVKTTGRSVTDKTPPCCRPRPRSPAINAGFVYAAAVAGGRAG
jgi:hypothetical protein